MEDMFKKLNDMLIQQFSWVGFIDNEDLRVQDDIFKVFLRVATVTKRQFYGIAGRYKFKDIKSRELFIDKVSKNLNPTYADESGGYMCSDFSYLNYEIGPLTFDQALSNKDGDPSIIDLNYKTFNKEEFRLITELLNNLKV